MSHLNRVVVAGAGTGKTYALVQAYIECLKKYKPSQILAITFTQKAAAEMRARVISKVQELGLSARGLLSAPICTFHALCAQIVGDEFGEFELLSPADDEKLCLKIAEEVILDSIDRVGHLVARFQIRGFGESQGLSDALVSLLYEIREQGNPPPLQKGGQGGFEDLIEAIHQAYNAFYASKLSPSARSKLDSFQEAFTRFLAVVSEGEPAFSAAFREMREALSGRFGDTILRANLLDAVLALGAYLCTVHTAPETNAIIELLKAYAERLDTYKKEHRVFGFADLLSLAKSILESQKTRFQCVLVDEYQDTSPIQEQLVKLLIREAKLFVVGDPKQSIYGFRGADASVFERVSGQRESLKLSRRSQGAVIDLVNLVAKATLPGFGEHESLEAMHAHQGQAGAILKQDWALHIRSLLDSGKKPSEIAILVRRIKAAAPMAAELQKLSVPVRIFGGEGFYLRQEISDFAAALMILIEPDLALAKLTLMRSPFCHLPDTALIDWQTQKLPALFDELRGLLGQKRVAELIDRLLIEGGYAQAIAAEQDGGQKLANILKLRTLLIDVRENYDEKIRELWTKLDRPQKESLAEPFSVTEEAVQIMTLHQSKGLEFPVIVLADLASTQPSDLEAIAFDPSVGLAVSHKNRPLALCAPQTTEEKKKFPTPIDAVRQAKRAKAEKELPRLLYVGLTRAKEKIYVIDLEESDRGLSLMRLFKNARELNQTLFDELMPEHHPVRS